MFMITVSSQILESFILDVNESEFLKLIFIKIGEKYQTQNVANREKYKKKIKRDLSKTQLNKFISKNKPRPKMYSYLKN